MRNETFQRRVSKQNRIPFLKGRPERDHVIDDEDLINLKIELETCKSLEEFVERT